jgi:hypothetical protein
MQHSIVYKKAGRYSMGPIPQLLPDGRLAIGLISSPFADHYGLADWVVLVSDDRGATFRETDDQTIPLAWPGANARERYDRFAAILPDGTYLAAGTVGFESWSADRAGEAEAMGVEARDHPDGSPDKLVVATPKLFVQRSRDQGRTWERREWIAPGLSWLTAFPRAAHLADGTILLPAYGRSAEKRPGQVFVWRSADEGETWRLIPVASSVADVNGDESALFEVSPGRVLLLMRHGSSSSHLKGYLLESWSEDAGLTWSHPLRTEIRGFPPHLLRLQDGRILCGVTYREQPMGIRVVVSGDDGRTWDTGRTLVLRDDAGTSSTLWANHGTRTGGSDVGYPITVQFPDGTLFTCYWITEADGITHVAATTWHPDEIGHGGN